MKSADMSATSNAIDSSSGYDPGSTAGSAWGAEFVYYNYLAK